MAGRLEVAGRRFLTAVVSRLVRPRSGEAWSWADTPPERILLVRHDDRIGNLILMTPLLQGVRKLWPEAEIGVLIGPRYTQTYQEEPEVDSLWILEKRRLLRNPLLFFRFLSQLRKAGWDMAIDCSHMHSFSLTGASLTFFSGAPVRVAYEREDAASFCNLLVDPLRAEHHESDILLNLLRPFTGELPDVRMQLHLSPEERFAALEKRAECGAGEGVLLGIHVGGRGNKRWAIERYENLIATILDLYSISIAVLCGPGEEAEAAHLHDRFGNSITLFDDFDLRQMLAFVSVCDFFICPDTGPMHAATAFGVPTVAIFLEDHWQRYGPVGNAHRIVRASPVNGEDEVLTAFAHLVSNRFSDDVIDAAGSPGGDDPE